MNSKQYIFIRVNQKKIKSSRKEYVTRVCFKFWPMKNIFGKLSANNSLITARLKNSARIIFVRDFSPSLFKFKTDILPPLRKQIYELENYLSYEAKKFFVA